MKITNTYIDGKKTIAVKADYIQNHSNGKVTEGTIEKRYTGFSEASAKRHFIKNYVNPTIAVGNQNGIKIIF